MCNNVKRPLRPPTGAGENRLGARAAPIALYITSSLRKQASEKCAIDHGTRACHVADVCIRAHAGFQHARTFSRLFDNEAPAGR